MAQGLMVIVGGGVAGGTAALTLRAEGYDGRIVLVSEEPHPPYSKPPLSKGVVRGEQAPEKAHLRPAKLWAAKDIELELGRGVERLDPAERTVHLRGGEALHYDAVLLATGGRPRTLPGLEDALTLRSLDDALALRERLGEGRTLAVVGAGFIGAELAASARTVGTAVTVYEAAPLPLARVLPRVIGERYAQLHRDHGVDLRLGTTLDPPAEADTVVVAIGIAPDVRLAEEAGLDIENGVVVDDRCRTSAPGVFAAGDVANHPNPLLGRRVRIEHWQNAQHQAQSAARNMLGADEPFAEVPWVWSDQYGHNLQVAGLPQPDDRVVVRGSLDDLDFIAYLVRDDRLAAVVAVNRADDVRAARSLIAAGSTPAELMEVSA